MLADAFYKILTNPQKSDHISSTKEYYADDSLPHINTHRNTNAWLKCVAVAEENVS